MGLSDRLAVVAGKLVSWISKKFGLGAGATWPGEIALRINPSILSSLISQIKHGVILIAGTNGKTTTAKMIQIILENNGFSVVHNDSGANLDNGIVSVLINSPDADWGVFEVDENTLPSVLKSVNPKILVLLNLFRDQLDRYGEVDVIAEKWQNAISKLPRDTTLVVNADDPLVAHLSIGAPTSVKYFGVSDKSKYLKEMEHATDSIFCLNCGTRLKYEGVYFSHIGVWSCPKCDESRPKLDLDRATSPLPGLYNLYNTLAATLASQEAGVGDNHIKKSLSSFSPAFGRQEEIENIKIFLSKNPAGFNQSLRTVLELGAKSILLVLNDRIPDGRDISWIWDVDFEMIPKSVSVRVSGERVYDLALRLKYAGIKTQIFKNLESALDTKEPLFVLPTYSAMLEVRQILKGRKIL